jgi:proline iminopeptidase
LTKLNVINSEGYTLSYAVEGQGHPALVIGSSVYYSRVFSSNIRKHLKMTFCDHRGFASTTRGSQASDFTLDKLLNDIQSIRKFLNIDSSVLIGHSIHAFMAIEYARRYPKAVSHLVLIGASPVVGQQVYQAAHEYFNQNASSERKLAFANSMEQFGVSRDHSFVSRMLAFGSKLWFDSHFDATSLWAGVEVNPIGAGVIWGDLFENYDTKAALHEVECPVLIALGRHDYFNPPYLWDHYQPSSKDLTINIFENSGHTPQLEESDRFDRVLLTQLTKNVA